MLRIVARQLLALALALPAAAALAADTHPLTVHDMLAMQRISDPQASPDGRLVAFVLRTTDLEANRGRTDLWLVNIDGSGLRQLTFTPEGESSPRWAPDGRSLFFISGRGGGQQVWQLPMNGGEARRVTNIEGLDVTSFAVAPDGARIVFSADVYPDCAKDPAGALACTAKRLKALESRKATGHLYTQLFVRHWDEWLDGRRSHLFVAPVAGGNVVDLMRDMDADSPSKPFGGPDEYTIADGGRTVLFSAKNVGREEAWSTNFDLFSVPADGSAAPADLTAANKAWDTAPIVSPDGKWLAYKAMSRPGYEADRYRIMLRALPGGAEHELAPSWDRSPSDMSWSADGKTLYVTADDLGHHPLFAVDAATGKVRKLAGDGTVSGFSTAGNVIVFARNSLRGPDELYTVKPDGTDVKRITHVNDERLAAVRMGEPEQFSFTGAGGDTVYGWIVRPIDFDASKKYPVAFIIHGGPQGSMGNDFHYRWNPQPYAARGYAAVMIDFHGSTGYGQKFTDAINGDWGGKPLEDLQKGLAAAIEKYKYLDGTRAAALGASYGGYMINWIAGAWPDRFRCLVSHDGNLDETFAYYDTEELWFPEWEHAGTPWQNGKGYAFQSPMSLVQNWKTPILVVHGGKDFRVVETQGIGTFTAAQRKGIPSEFLYFPDENHWVLKPQNSILWHETVLNWLDRWTK